MSREADLDRLYELLIDLEDRVSGKHRLKNCTGYLDWPKRGVYFLFAHDEYRDTDDQHRLTRIGTHAVSSGSGASLWSRLRTHRGANSGTYAGGGNHRGSVFRKHIGKALIERHNFHAEYPYWGDGSSADPSRRLNEHDLERQVSDHIRDLPFLWIDVDDEPGPDSDRAYIEQNAIVLVSNFEKDGLDRRNSDWVGAESPRQAIRNSGLWNINHVNGDYDSAFLDRVAEAVKDTTPV